jgi:hypothetical protein
MLDKFRRDLLLGHGDLHNTIAITEQKEANATEVAKLVHPPRNGHVSFWDDCARARQLH